MLTITILLLVAGTLLAALGTLGFLAVWQAPDPDDFQLARKTATIGRWLTIPGLSLYAGHYGASGIGLYLLMLAVAITMASLITKTTTRPATAAGAAR
jgi:multisubunit Na+/H+ antiporter MnhG subunit